VVRLVKKNYRGGKRLGNGGGSFARVDAVTRKKRSGIPAGRDVDGSGNRPGGDQHVEEKGKTVSRPEKGRDPG